MQRGTNGEARGFEDCPGPPAGRDKLMIFLERLVRWDGESEELPGA